MIIFDKPLSIFVLWQEIVDFVVVLSKESIVDARNEKKAEKLFLWFFTTTLWNLIPFFLY